MRISCIVTRPPRYLLISRSAVELLSQMLVCIYLCLLMGVCGSQAPVRLDSVSNPNRFDFSLLATGAPDGSVLIAGADFLTRVAPDFQQSSISNVQNLPLTLSMVAFDHFSNRYMACSRDRLCHFYATSNVSYSVASVSIFPSTGNIPKTAVFAMLAGSPAVYLYGSFLTSSKTSTRCVLFIVSSQFHIGATAVVSLVSYQRNGANHLYNNDIITSSSI